MGSSRESRQLITFSFFFKTFYFPKKYSHVFRQVSTATIAALSRYQVIGKGTKGGRTNLHLVVTSAHSAETAWWCHILLPNASVSLSPLYNPQQ